MTTTVFIIQSLANSFSISAEELCLDPTAYRDSLKPTLHFKEDGCYFYFSFLSADLALAYLRKQNPERHFWVTGMVVENTHYFQSPKPQAESLKT